MTASPCFLSKGSLAGSQATYFILTCSKLLIALSEDVSDGGCEGLIQTMGCMPPPQRAQDSLLSQTGITYNPLTQKNPSLLVHYAEHGHMSQHLPWDPGGSLAQRAECAPGALEVPLLTNPLLCILPSSSAHTRGRQKVNKGRDNTNTPSETIASSQMPLFL